MKHALCLPLIGLLLMPLSSFAADGASTSIPTVTNKMKPALAPIKNKKLLDAAKALKPSSATTDDSNTNTTVPETYTIAIESPSLIQDSDTCRYTWTIRIKNTGTASFLDGDLSVVTQAIKQDHSHVGAARTIPLGAIQPGESYPVGGSVDETSPEATSFVIGVQKGPENMGSVNYPFVPKASCVQQQ